MIALSYPLRHQLFDEVFPDMGVNDWGASTASVTSEILNQFGYKRRVTLIGWSMAGKAVAAFTRHAARLDLEVEAFVSIAATAPLPGLAASKPGLITLTPDGLRDTSSQGAALDSMMWRGGLGAQHDLIGHVVIGDDVYHRAYRGDYPLGLRGEYEQPVGGTLVRDWHMAIEDLGGFDFGSYPLTGMVIPTSQDDARHALTDQATWTMINAQAVYARFYANRTISSDAWQALRELTRDLPTRLTRFVDGGHFCFIGEAGAQAVAANVIDLHGAILQMNARALSLAPISTSPQEG